MSVHGRTCIRGMKHGQIWYGMSMLEKVYEKRKILKAIKESQIVETYCEE